MTVKELKALLNQFDENSELMVHDKDSRFYQGPVRMVEKTIYVSEECGEGTHIQSEYYPTPKKAVIILY